MTDAEREAIAADIEAGMSRNDVCRKHGRGAGTVSAIAKARGLSFERAATRAATEARQADFEDRISRLAEDLLSDAERLRAQLWEPCRFVPSGRDWREWVRAKADAGEGVEEGLFELAEPTPADKRHIVAATRMCVMTLHDIRARAKGGDQGRSMIERLVAGLAAAMEGEAA